MCCPILGHPRVFAVASKELKANACHALLRIIGLVSLMEDVDETQPNNSGGRIPAAATVMQEQAEKKVAWNKGSTAAAQAQGRHQPWEESTHQGYPPSQHTALVGSRPIFNLTSRLEIDDE